MFGKFSKEAIAPAIGIVGGGGIGAYAGAALGTAAARTVSAMMAGALIEGAVGYIGRDIHNRFADEPEESETESGSRD